MKRVGEVYSLPAPFCLLQRETDLREGAKSAIMKKNKTWYKNGI